MPTTTIVFIVVLLIVSGGVAWAADNFGRVLGKRRVAIFGLRPRNTAILITVVAGMLITGGTIFAMALASEAVRDMIFRIDVIRSELSRLREERSSLVEERDSARVALDALMGDMAEAHLEIEGLTFQVSTVERELVVMLGEVESLLEDKGTLEEEIESLRDDLQSFQAEYDALVAAKEAEAERLEAEIAQRNQLIGEKEATLIQLDREIGDLNQEIADLNRQIVAMEQGEVKVVEGRQLGAVLVSTEDDNATNFAILRGLVERIPVSYRDPETGQAVLSDNEMAEIGRDVLDETILRINAIPAPKAVVIVYATANVFEDEPVSVRFEVTGYYKVFTSGSLIFSRLYQQPEETAEPYRATVASFLGEARDHLVNERNFIPSGAGEVMQFTIDEILSLSDRLSRVGFPAEIRIEALKDIYRTDFLYFGDHFTVAILPGIPEEAE